LGRLFGAKHRPAADMRPAMLSVISLMVILLPLILMTTSARKLSGLTLVVPGPSEILPPEPPGPVENLTVTRLSSGFRVVADVRNTDVLASAGDTEHKEMVLPDLSSLQAQLRTLKTLDPGRKQVRLIPSPTAKTTDVVRWMDAVRSDRQGELFPKVLLQTAPMHTDEANPCAG